MHVVQSLFAITGISGSEVLDSWSWCTYARPKMVKQARIKIPSQPFCCQSVSPLPPLLLLRWASRQAARRGRLALAYLQATQWGSETVESCANAESVIDRSINQCPSFKTKHHIITIQRAMAQFKVQNWAVSPVVHGVSEQSFLLLLQRSDRGSGNNCAAKNGQTFLRASGTLQSSGRDGPEVGGVGVAESGWYMQHNLYYRNYTIL